MTEIHLYDDISIIKGIGEKKKLALNSIGINKVYELIDHIPFRYQDKRHPIPSNQMKPGMDSLLEGTLKRKSMRRLGGYKTIIECEFSDKSGIFHATFFNMPYLEKNLTVGSKYALFGRIRMFNSNKVITNPEISVAGSDKDRRGLIPVYRCTSGIKSNDFIKWIEYVLACTKELEYEWLDESIIESNNLCGRLYEYRNLHFPEDEHKYKVAKYRYIYEKLLAYLYSVKENAKKIDESSDASINTCSLDSFLNEIPFKLTDGQNMAIENIIKDLKSQHPMNRLVQGDVGCGKTVVAEAAIFEAVSDGKQCAYMAPTEILARQVYDKIKDLFERFNIRTELLVSSVTRSERKRILEDVQSGEVAIVVGTHALIQDDVQFNKLLLAVTDEQHRFGVNQRKNLASKAVSVNILVMTATPIPRTLANTVFGDMNFSIIKNKPANRKTTITRVVDSNGRERAYRDVRNQIEEGYQAFIVAPSIEDNEENELSSAEGLFKELKTKFGGWKVEYIHGKMKSDEKEKLMMSFKNREIDILVSTVVIEVGIDIPNANIIVIENSERFGLAQLHQLRGRVGRSSAQSYCYLVNYSKSDSAKARMDAMVKYSDGFEISEKDYELRGPGDLMGTMQHGLTGSDIAKYFGYSKIVERASKDADKILREEVRGVDMKQLRDHINQITVTDNRDTI